DLALAWVTLRRRPQAQKKIALVLGNYPVRDGRMANGVGLDTPQAVVDILAEMGRAGYQIGAPPEEAADLMTALQNRATNDLARRRQRHSEILDDPTTIFYEITDYQRAFAQLSPHLQNSIRAKWGDAETDPYLLQKPDGSRSFPIAALVFQNIVVMLQPPRGYALDEEQQNYHDPALIPPHYYWACYFWLRHQFGVQAIIHIGKHGTLEWLPGKSVALSPDCLPQAMLGAIPVIYPFIVNDPGEGSQAKRRNAAVIIDHLTPPLTQAGSYGEAAQLEALIDEYYQATQFATNFDLKRQKFLQTAITELAEKSGIAAEAGLKFTPNLQNDSGYLPQLDAYLCDLKEWQIRDGLHIFGQTPAGTSEIALLLALARIPRGMGRGKDASLARALAADLALRATPESEIFDPLTADRAINWTGAKPPQLQAVSDTVWRHSGDTIERLELFAAHMVADCLNPARHDPNPPQTALDPTKFPAVHPVLEWMVDELTPHLRQSGRAEMAALLAALSGRFVAPGPSGAPSRGRPDCLPTGRNFYSLDARSMPTQAAWRVGWQSACLMLERHLQENGEDLRRLVLSCWGTAQMRTGGDDIAQALALMGVQPQWEPESGRVIGFDIIPVSALGRPRVDVTLRISGFFRDAFPNLIDLFDRASRAVATLPPELESAADNPLADAYRRRATAWQKSGMDATTAELMAGYRIFGAKTGSYGAGLQHIMDEEAWQNDGELSEIFLSWSRFAYGSDGQGGSLAGEDRLAPAIAAAVQSQALRDLLAASQAVVQNQDNREHDLLDSDDYYQFEGGLAATIKHLSGTLPALYHNDHSRPDHPVIRSLSEELSRVIRARVTNPRWLDGVRRHGYKGASEMTASLDYMAAFQALTHQIKDHQFDAVYQAFLGDAENLAFLRAHNPAALQEMAAKFQSLIDRGLWQSQRNAIYEELRQLQQARPERSDELTKTREKLRPA
ncbi:MAG: cobaltochelatase subunit CobN, partial [Alphaproteobacteria bacterium]|nr:cobaltochelatase subunit CobN [Alphaproteobacteria bacterium]